MKLSETLLWQNSQTASINKMQDKAVINGQSIAFESNLRFAEPEGPQSSDSGAQMPEKAKPAGKDRARSLWRASSSSA